MIIRTNFKTSALLSDSAKAMFNRHAERQKDGDNVVIYSKLAQDFSGLYNS